MATLPLDNLARVEGIPSVQGPTSINSTLLDSVSGVPYEGIWVPWLFTKQGSLEISGVMSTLSCQLYGTNTLYPLNSYTITIGGTAATGNVLTTAVSTPFGTWSPAFTDTAGNTTTVIAAGVAAAVNAVPQLQALQILASASGPVVTITWPSQTPNSSFFPYTTSSPAVGQTLTITTSVSGTASETMTAAAGATGSALGTAITSLGMTQFTLSARWLKLRITTLTGGSITAIAQGTA